MQTVHTLHIIAGGLIIGGVFILAQIDAQQRVDQPATGTHPVETARHGVHTVVIKAHAVNQRLMLGQTKHARLRVAGLGQGSHGAHLNEAETAAG